MSGYPHTRSSSRAHHRSIEQLPDEVMKLSFNTVFKEETSLAFIKQIYSSVDKVYDDEDNKIFHYEIEYYALFAFSRTITNIKWIVENAMNDSDWYPKVNQYYHVDHDNDIVNEDNHDTETFNYDGGLFQVIPPSEAFEGVIVWNNPDLALMTDFDYSEAFRDALDNIVQYMCRVGNEAGLSYTVLADHAPLGKVYELRRTATRTPNRISDRNLAITSLAQTNKHFRRMARRIQGS